MKKIFLLCIAALCFCAAGLFAACDDAAGGRPAGETGDQVSEETPQIGGGDVCDHGWGAWQTVFEAECGKNGLKICHCTACGASKAEIIPALAHTAENRVYDQSTHWRVCERCGEIFGKEEHAFGGDACACGYVCDFTRGLEYEKIEGKEEYRVTGEGSFSGNEIIVPATYKGLPVTEVGGFAFSDLNAQKIVLPESVQRIGSQAFSRCTAKEIVLPQKMQSLGDAAFNSCSNLQKINLPEGIERVGESAFSNCYSQRELVIPDSVTEIGYRAFDRCSRLTRVTLGKNLESIDYAFYKCDRLFEVYNRSVLPVEADGTNKYGGLAKNAKNLYGIGTGYSRINTTENGIRYFEDAEEVCLLDYYGTETELTLPETIKGKPCVLAEYAFDGAENIQKLTIPGGIKNIPYNCFSGMPDLSKLVLEEGVESIESNCFVGTGLTEAELPASLTSLSGDMFGANVTKISVAAGNPVYKSVDNCVIETASKTLVWGCAASVIPTDGSVTVIGEKAFYGRSLQTIAIPAGVTVIGENAFSLCSQLKEIVIPASVKEIGASAFSSSGLEKVTLSEGLETIGLYAFAYCGDLKEISIPSTVKTVYASAFYDTPLEKLHFAETSGWQVKKRPGDPADAAIAEESLSDPADAARTFAEYAGRYADRVTAAWVREA